MKTLTFWLWLWTSCAVWVSQPATANAANESRRIVVLGDSLTAGYGVDPADAYPALLQKKIERAALRVEVNRITLHIAAGGLDRQPS